MIIYSAFIRYWREKREYNGTVHHPFIDFNKVYYSFGREVLYNIHIEFSLSMKLVRLIEMCLNETYMKSVWVNIYPMHFLFRMV
jgi:hypothetical protein